MKRLFLLIFIACSVVCGYSQDSAPEKAKTKYLETKKDGVIIGYRTINTSPKKIIIRHYNIEKTEVVKTIVIDLETAQGKFVPNIENGKLVGFKTITRGEKKIVIDYYPLDKSEIIKTIVIELKSFYNRDFDELEDFVQDSEGPKEIVISETKPNTNTINIGDGETVSEDYAEQGQ